MKKELFFGLLFFFLGFASLGKGIDYFINNEHVNFTLHPSSISFASHEDQKEVTLTVTASHVTKEVYVCRAPCTHITHWTTLTTLGNETMLNASSGLIKKVLVSRSLVSTGENYIYVYACLAGVCVWLQQELFVTEAACTQGICQGQIPLRCQNGKYIPYGLCNIDQVCEAAVCKCTQSKCVGQTLYHCDTATGNTQNITCTAQEQCSTTENRCIPRLNVTCQIGEIQCNAEKRQECQKDGQWKDLEPCLYGCNLTTVLCNPPPNCAPNQVACEGNAPKTCKADGTWQSNTSCSENKLNTCVYGVLIQKDCPAGCDSAAKSCKAQPTCTFITKCKTISALLTCERKTGQIAESTCPISAPVCKNGKCAPRTPRLPRPRGWL